MGCSVSEKAHRCGLHGSDLLPVLSSASAVHLRGVYGAPVPCGGCLLLLEPLNVGESSCR